MHCAKIGAPQKSMSNNQFTNIEDSLYTNSHGLVELELRRGCTGFRMVYKPALPPGPKPGGSLPIGFNSSWSALLG
jgi:hypothetical protein